MKNRVPTNVNYLRFWKKVTTYSVPVSWILAGDLRFLGQKQRTVSAHSNSSTKSSSMETISQLFKKQSISFQPMNENHSPSALEDLAILNHSWHWLRPAWCPSGHTLHSHMQARSSEKKSLAEDLLLTALEIFPTHTFNRWAHYNLSQFPQGNKYKEGQVTPPNTMNHTTGNGA